ncbi:MAG: hypothetical protein IJ265_00820, partial [Oscillospiraceae bacterium]|nr:hypothetical protein [Oscillospiraceae bacterium]
ETIAPCYRFSLSKKSFFWGSTPKIVPTPTPPPEGEGLYCEGTAYPQPAQGLRPLNLTRLFDRLKRYPLAIVFLSDFQRKKGALVHAAFICIKLILLKILNFSIAILVNLWYNVRKTVKEEAI